MKHLSEIVKNNLLYKIQNLLLPFSLISIFVRITETVSLASKPVVGMTIIWYELIGFGSDLLIIGLFVCIYTVMVLLFPRIQQMSKAIVNVLFVSYSMLASGLSTYFQLLLYPLDKVIFRFPLNEIANIAYSSSKSLSNELLPFLVILLIGAVGSWASYRIKFKKSLLYTAISIMIIQLAILILGLNKKYINSQISYYASENRVFQLFRYNDDVGYHLNNSSEKLKQNVELYHNIRKDQKFISSEYPFLHEEDYRDDVLSPYFDSITQKPSIVFIIVESLARSICGPDAKNGSCTPYLDSLIEHSLYWENHYSTAERTFEVFPSSLGSLPYGNEGFTRLANTPNHFSIIKLLGRNGYYTAFYHPADFKIYFDNWWRFFATQNIDTILDIHSFPKLRGFDEKNGQPDEILFSYAGEFIKQQKEPALHILLTSSMHEPYIIPNQKAREEETRLLIESNTKLSNRQKNIMLHDLDRTAAVFYTDGQIGKFIESYKQNPEFENTIFVIFGDHSAYNYDPHNQAEQYHVPLIIYSPLIKQPKKFTGINSHLDITPTLLCLLKNACSLDLPKYTHWLGNRLDTSSVGRVNKRIPFMSVSRICKDYLHGSEYISGKQLYDYQDNIMVKKDKPERLKTLEKELGNYMYINNYVCTQNKLLPDSIFYKYSAKTDVLKSEDIAVNEEMDPTQEYFGFDRIRVFDTSMHNYVARITFKMKSLKTGKYEMPRLVVSGNDSQTDEQLCYQVEFMSRKDLRPLEENEWQEIVISQSTNMLSDLRDSMDLSVYLWNPERTPTYFKDVHYELIGVCKN